MSYFDQSSSGTFRGWHCRCAPGTDNEVMSIVTHLSRKTVPDSAKNLRNKINLFHIY